MKTEFVNQDCMILMKRYPDQFFDLAIVDPPYGLPKGSTQGGGRLKNRKMNTEDMSWDVAPGPDYFKELFRVSKNQIVWGGNYFSMPPTRGFIVWDKKQPWENFSRAEYAWTSFQVPSKIFEFDNRTGDKIHPTQKPIKLYTWILTNYAEKGQVILDTHVGSGSSLIACEEMGHDYAGSEISPDFYRLANERILKYREQPKLFEG